MTFTISQPNWALDATPSLVISALSHFGLIEITGEQGRSFVHGQVTTDISSLEQDQWRWGAHCNPKGKMLATFRTFALADSLFMLLPKDTLAIDLPQLKKYAVFSKAEIEDASANWHLFGISGSDAQQWVNEQFGEVSAEVTAIEGGCIIKDNGRYILMLAKSQADSVLERIKQPIYDCCTWKEEEIRAGYPNLAAKHQEQFVPQMCNVQAIDGISFNKGCYMGQETVARMKYRGGNKRALYILSGLSGEPLSLDSQLEIAEDDNDSYRPVGSIIEFSQRDGQVLLTAVLPNDTSANARLRIAGNSQSELQIQALPYALEE